MLLFIDFRKAFDLVDSRILLRKLFHYGFDDNSIQLIADYFKQRSQTVKMKNKFSDPKVTTLGVPQGSVLGPLFFLIYINDLAFLLDLSCKMFADDTTLYETNTKVDSLISSFLKKIEPLFDWCKFNRLDINWSKTFFMFVTNKHIKNQIPNDINVLGYSVKVIESFKLLGITIDNGLKFDKYTSELRTIINRKMFSIKRLFYLNTSVKIQFFKTFLLPYFDYCLSLFIYFPKSAIQRICNIYNICLYKLFKFKLESNNLMDEAFIDDNPDSNIENHDELSVQRKKDDLYDSIQRFNAHLAGYKLESFQMIIFKKLMIFSHGIINNTEAPVNLKNGIENQTADSNLIGVYELFKTPDVIPSTARGKRYLKYQQREDIVVTNKFEELTFSFFFSKLTMYFSSLFSINKLSKFLNEFSFKNLSHLNNFSTLFSKFNLSYQTYNYKKKKITIKKQTKKT